LIALELKHFIFILIIKARAGDIGGNTLGFYGACFDPTGTYIVAHWLSGSVAFVEKKLKCT
jgi:hypothetical protein